MRYVRYVLQNRSRRRTSLPCGFARDFWAVIDASKIDDIYYSNLHRLPHPPPPTAERLHRPLQPSVVGTSGSGATIMYSREICPQWQSPFVHASRTPACEHTVWNTMALSRLSCLSFSFAFLGWCCSWPSIKGLTYEVGVFYSVEKIKKISLI